MSYLSIPTLDLRPQTTRLTQAQRAQCTVGVLGGMSPQSTSLFYEAVSQFCLAHYPTVYPRLLINSVNCWEVVDILAKRKPQELTRFLCQEMDYIQAGADFLVMVCNSVHAVLPQLRKLVSVPIMAIHEEVCKDLALANINRVGILGTRTTIDSHLYQNELATYGIRAVQLPPNKVAEFDACIFQEMIHGRASVKMRRLIMAGIDHLADSGCEAVILGCTELPLFVNQSDTAMPLFPSTQILARAVVEGCFGRW